ncbi:sugar transferase EpsL [Aneurinibacillus soli]|uniref:Putative sugar transferase EpsL n=1 Tax=Aneurinibacillus soli TaxID=1500254 RepID=A0A0U4WHH2_9BACL|nr:sugar transferase [Aneurinibacillus soli]PYE64140.1 sugar transferase EpsL [Aneurinibacillus soli]BAU28089.1 putative sugar transferase EpsL [Aneurinibacillus soli]
MKRALDVIVSLILLAILSPVILLITVLIRIKLGSPVFFRQKRPGLRAVPFYIYKFRTMTDERDENGKLLSDTVRLRSFGRFLRKYSLDELPQLLNVLRGELSLVGPRPLLMEYVPLYTETQARRHEVRPGITGWAQVNGRNALTWEEKFILDVWYVDHQSFWLDIKILMMTFFKVIRSEDINSKGHATMPVFTGKSERSKRFEM